MAGDEVGAGEGFGAGTALGRVGLGRDWLEGALGRGAEVGDLRSGSLPSPAAVAEIEKKMQEKIRGNFMLCTITWKTY